MSERSDNATAVDRAPQGGQDRPLWELAKVAVPTVATMSSYTVMTMTDKWLCSQIGPDPIYVGAQGNGGLAAWVPISVAQGVIMIVNTYVSQNLGAGKPERGPAYAWNAMWLAVAYWLVLLVPYALALPWIFSVSGMDERQGAMAAEYAQILVLGGFLTLMCRAVSQYFYGMHRAGVVLVAGVAANVLNLFISCVLVYGNGPMPESLGLFGRACGSVAQALNIAPMGIPGSAIGTVIATGLELLIPLAVFLSPAMHAKARTRSAWRLSVSHQKDLFRLGWPGGLMFGNEMVCWGFFMVYLVSHFGKAHATAGWIAHQYMSLSFMPAVGISVAVTALVGKCMGMGRPDLAAQRAWLGLRIACVYMGLCGAAFVIFRDQLVGVFVSGETPPAEAEMVMKLGAQMLIATAAFQLFDAVAMVMSGALRGAGDTVFPGVCTVVAAWTVIVGGGLAMVNLFPSLESLGGWIAAAAYIAVLCVILLGRFLTGKWKSMKVVKDQADPADAQSAMTTDGML
ncbi:MAG: MATE family efflux transporter [Planctomycetota bacterium]|nr:MATE family efflux transporter [Planctomycetota bacterium]